jgi:hypothetical protein
MSCSWIGWCALGVQGQAAWVQALGSIAAILVAIAVPAYQHRVTRRREGQAASLRARALSLAVLADLEIVAKRLDAIWTFEHPDTLPNVHDNPGTKNLGHRTLAAIEIPQTLQSRIDTLHEMGPGGDAALRCIHHLVRARELVTGLPGDVQVTFDADRFYDFLWAATGDVVSALNRIDAHFVTPKRPPGQKNTAGD